MMNPTKFIKRCGTLSALAIVATFGSPELKAGFPEGQAPENSSAPNEEGYEAIADEVIVRFSQNANNQHIEAALNRVGGKILKHRRTEMMKAQGLTGLSLVSVNLPVPQAVAALRNMPGVDHAEPNWVYQKLGQPQNQDTQFETQATMGPIANDWFYAKLDPSWDLWGMYGDTSGNVSYPANIYGSQADETWALTLSGDVYVGVIDEGICFNHPELAGSIVNPGEFGEYYDVNGVLKRKEADGIDNDANGKVDDVNGWDFVSEDNTVFDPTPDNGDIDAHGTHVAGTISAKMDGVNGVVGVFPSVKIISGKFLAPNGGTTYDAIEAVDYFTDLRVHRGVNVVALNNSWGGGGYSSELHAAIIRAAQAKILFFAAAGNGNWRGVGQNNDTTPSYPASYDTTKAVTVQGVTYVADYDSVIAVAAIDSSGNKARFSNYGATSVDIGAPGVGIVSTYPVVPDSTTSHGWNWDPKNEAYMPYSGTSMATPHVTGAAALYAARWPNATPAQVKAALLNTAIPTSSLAGKSVSGGRLNLARVNDEDPSTQPAVPSTPTNLNGSSTTRGQVNLSWSDTTTETSYQLDRATNSSFTSGKATISLGANTVSYVDKNLKSRTTYYYRIRAVHTAGASPYSSTVSVTCK